MSENGEVRREHVLNGIARSPLAAVPGTLVENRWLPSWHAVAKTRRKLCGIVRARRGKRIQRRLSENAVHVVKRWDTAQPYVPTRVESEIREHTGLILPREALFDSRADQVNAFHHRGGNVRIQRLGVRRHKNPRRKRRRLMLVVNNLRKPFAEQKAGVMSR